MTLVVGELMTYLRADDRQMQEVLNRAPGRARDSLGRFTRVAGEEGTRAGNELGRNLGNAGEREAQRAGQQIGNGLGSKLKEALKGAALVAAGGGLLAFFSSAKDAASDLAESIGKSDIIFGRNAGEIRDWASTAAESVGLSKQAALEAAASFGDMFLQLGIADSEAAGLSTSTVQLAADLGSFSNLETSDVLDRISGALRGEYDSLQAVIPNINAARVESEALATSGKSTATELTAAEKAMAVLAIVTKDGSRALGNYAATADGVANTEKTLAAQWVNTQAAIGEGLLPAYSAFLGLLQDLMPIIEGVGSAVGGALTWFTELPGPVQAGAAAFALWLAVGPAITSFLVGLKAKLVAATTSTVAFRVAVLAALGGPVGAAILAVTAAATVAFALFSSDANKAEAAVTDFSAAVDASTGALKSNAAEIVAQAASKGAEAYRDIGGAAGDYTAALLGNAEAQDRVHTAILDAATAAVLASGSFKGTAEEARKFASEQLASGAATSALGQEMTNALVVNAQFAADTDNLAGTLKTSGVAAEEAATATGKLGDAAGEASPPVDRVAEALERGKEAANDEKQAIDFLNTALLELAGGSVDAAAAAREHEAKVREVASSSRELAEAHAKVDEASAALTEAQNNLGKSLEEGGTTAADVARAERDLADAQDGVRDASDQQADSLDELGASARGTIARAYEYAAANGDLEGATKTATAAARNQREAFIRSAVAAGYSQSAAESLADAQGLIPSNVETEYAAIGAAAAQGAAQNVDSSVRQIPPLKTVTITANGVSRTYFDGVKYSIDSIPSTKSVYISVSGNYDAAVQRARNAGGHHGGAVPLGYAGGGATPETGPFNRDNQLALLHRGEHVMDGDDVRGMGGQAGVYRFRRALEAGGVEAAAAVLLTARTVRRMSAGGAMTPGGGVGAVSGPAGYGKQINFNGPITFPAGTDYSAVVNHAVREALR